MIVFLFFGASAVFIAWYVFRRSNSKIRLKLCFLFVAGVYVLPVQFTKRTTSQRGEALDPHICSSSVRTCSSCNVRRNDKWKTSRVSRLPYESRQADRTEPSIILEIKTIIAVYVVVVSSSVNHTRVDDAVFIGISNTSRKVMVQNNLSLTRAINR